MTVSSFSSSQSIIITFECSIECNWKTWLAVENQNVYRIIIVFFNIERNENFSRVIAIHSINWWFPVSFHPEKKNRAPYSFQHSSLAVLVYRNEHHYVWISFKQFLILLFQIKNSTDTVVVLRRVTIQSTGKYRCEVSGEAPAFQTISDHGDMMVVGKFFVYFFIILLFKKKTF